MTVPWPNVEGVAGLTGIGALCILAIFLLFDGRYPDLFPTVELLSKTATWGVVVAVPVLVLAYVIGLIVVNGASLLLDQFTVTAVISRSADLLTIAHFDKGSVTEQYLRLYQEKELLAGSSLALLLLAFGAWSETRNLPQLRWAIILSGMASLVLAVLTLYLASSKGQAAHALVEAVLLLP